MLRRDAEEKKTTTTRTEQQVLNYLRPVETTCSINDKTTTMSYQQTEAAKNGRERCQLYLTGTAINCQSNQQAASIDKSTPNAGNLSNTLNQNSASSLKSDARHQSQPQQFNVMQIILKRMPKSFRVFTSGITDNNFINSGRKKHPKKSVALLSQNNRRSTITNSYQGTTTSRIPKASFNMMFTVISSCCFLLTAAAMSSNCTPTLNSKTTVNPEASRHNQYPQSSVSSDNIKAEAGILQPQANKRKPLNQLDNDLVVVHRRIQSELGGDMQTVTKMSHKLNSEGAINIEPVVVLNKNDYPTHDKFSKQQQLVLKQQPSISMPSIQRLPTYDSVVAAADDETILLLLASDISTSSSSPSLRRLIKRSGTSDQRLAEIQMLRALKKQLEQRANKIANESNNGGGNGGDGAVSEGQAS